jgi:SAM-dependent methyltransferase
LKPASFFDALYERTPEGWDFSRRRSQLFRYGTYFELIERHGLCPETVLDLGCGEGYLAARIRKRWGCQLIGIDLSVVAIERARRRYPDIEFYEGNITDIRWDCIGLGRRLDLIVLGEVLTYLDEDERASTVEKIYSRMWNGACILVSVNIGPPPYFTRAGLYELFRQFRCLDRRGIYLRSYYRRIETPVCNLRLARRVKAFRPADEVLAMFLEFAPIRAINAVSGWISQSQESVHVALFRKEPSEL